jgi:hypothetical protein
MQTTRGARQLCKRVGVCVGGVCLAGGLIAGPLFAQDAAPATTPAAPATVPATPSAPAPAPAAAATASTSAAGAAGPIAIVPLDAGKPGGGATVTGALEVTGGKAIIAASGTVTSGSETTEVVLPHRGTLRVCASTSVKLAADSTVQAGGDPGLMMALDHGAIEASYATGKNADILLTPDFRILISGPGAAEVKIRLGEHGDTCVDNPGLNAPYVLVTSVFDGSDYRVQPGQRVMFQHGSIHEVVDQEKEPCGCPVPVKVGSNEFPLAQSAGLAPLPVPAPAPVLPPTQKNQVTEPLVFKSAAAAPAPVVVPPPAPVAETVAAPAPVVAPHAAKKKPGFFRSIGRFFKRIFGAE